MTAARNAIRDGTGRVLFSCSQLCWGPTCSGLGLRLPDEGEPQGDYLLRRTSRRSPSLTVHAPGTPFDVSWRTGCGDGAFALACA